MRPRAGRRGGCPCCEPHGGGVVDGHGRRTVGDADTAPRTDLIDDLVAAVSGYGPLQRYLDDPGVEEIWINDPPLVRSEFLQFIDT